MKGLFLGSLPLGERLGFGYRADRHTYGMVDFTEYGCQFFISCESFPALLILDDTDKVRSYVTVGRRPTDLAGEIHGLP